MIEDFEDVIVKQTKKIITVYTSSLNDTRLEY